MTSWRDTRPERPAGTYLVCGVEFAGGGRSEAAVGPHVRTAFAALGIVEVPADPEPTPVDDVAADEDTLEPEAAATPRARRTRAK